ncbi:unnamed protein product, partial [Mesorhabditis belari]|uniref:Uncharacterized protein n=1 Tax=Mesorhabditis belari TaxID=2138241 RepID=A0AAF3FBS4_9BILA
MVKHSDECNGRCELETRDFIDDAGNETCYVELPKCKWREFDKYSEKAADELIAEIEAEGDDLMCLYPPPPVPTRQNVDGLLRKQAFSLYSNEFANAAAAKVEFDDLQPQSGNDEDSKLILMEERYESVDFEIAREHAYKRSNGCGVSVKGQQKWKLSENFPHCPFPVLFADHPLIKALEKLPWEAERMIINELESDENSLPIHIRKNPFVPTPIHIAIWERNVEIIDIYLKLAGARANGIRITQSAEEKCQFWLKSWLKSFSVSPYNAIADNSRLWQSDDTSTPNHSKIDQTLLEKINQLISIIPPDRQFSFEILRWGDAGYQGRGQPTEIENPVSIACSSGDLGLLKALLSSILEYICDSDEDAFSFMLYIESALLNLIRFGDVAVFEEGSDLIWNFVGDVYNQWGNVFPESSKGNDKHQLKIVGLDSTFSAAIATGLPEMEKAVTKFWQSFKDTFGFSFAVTNLDDECRVAETAIAGEFSPTE